jgi:hypothetical protein
MLDEKMANITASSCRGAGQAAGRPKRCLERAKRLSTLLVQAQGSEAQAAEGFWGGKGKKESKKSAGSRRGAAQAVGGPL